MFYCHNIGGGWQMERVKEGGRGGRRDVINIYLNNGQHLERHNGNYLECPAVVL